jgi:hypothetical protein
MAHVHGFMRAVLGDTAATALRKATDRSEALDSVVGSRVIIGWLGFAAQFGYDGEIPGLPGSMLSFRKADDGSLFNGAISIGGDLFDFQHASQTQLAATLSVALGANRQVSPTLRDSDLVPLGKNIDLLIKGQVLRRLQKQTQEPGGVAAAPRAPDAPQEPGAPLPQKKGNVQPPQARSDQPEGDEEPGGLEVLRLRCAELQPAWRLHRLLLRADCATWRRARRA